MKYSELIEEIARDCEITKQAAADAMLVLRDVIQRELGRGGEVSIPEIGVFATVMRAERQGRNPQTGERMTIPAHRAVRFRPARALKALVRRG